MRKNHLGILTLGPTLVYGRHGGPVRVCATPPDVAGKMQRALSVIEQAWPAGNDILALLTSRIIPLKASGVVSFSYRHQPGLSFINCFDRDALDLIDDLIHENSHHHLNLLLRKYVLYRGDWNREIFYSPWRRTLRPIRGILHATFTFAMGASLFERLVATLDYPLYVVTTAVQNEPAGCLVGFATQCSIHPPRFVACISNKNHTLLVARRAAILGVHIIEKSDKYIAEVFGGETGDEVDKFARVSWHYAHGVPKLDACERWFAGSVLEQIVLGDEPGRAEHDHAFAVHDVRGRNHRDAQPIEHAGRGLAHRITRAELTRVAGEPLDRVVLDAQADAAGFEKLLKARLAASELSVIISRKPCILAAAKIRQYDEANKAKATDACTCDCACAKT